MKTPITEANRFGLILIAALVLMLIACAFGGAQYVCC